MCGIAGIIPFNSCINTVSVIKKMSDTIQHRGPDDEGFLLLEKSTITLAGGRSTPMDVYASSIFYAPQKKIEECLQDNFSLALAHRRLSILDLSPLGHQPMCNASQDVWITFNGEIYNFIEIRSELILLGHTFHTNTDTEVIIAAYKQWGRDCVQKFDGMWSFALLDKSQNTIWLCRDRQGVKPLYYVFNKNYFAFASEQKVLLSIPNCNKTVNQKAVIDYFLFSELEKNKEGFIQEILELPPSHSLVFNINNHTYIIEQYYSLFQRLQNYEIEEKTEDDIKEKLLSLVQNAIKLRMRSDVEVGSCLSGGIDSASIVGIMSAFSQTPIHTFTASFKDQKVDESKWAKEVVDFTNANWHQVFPNSTQLLQQLKELIYCQDIPIWSTSTFAQFSTMELVKKQGIKVILDGQGGDELFGGYPHHKITYWNQLIKEKKVAQLFSEVDNWKFFGKQYAKQHILSKFNYNIRLQSIFYPHLRYLNSDFIEANRDYIKQRVEESQTDLNKQLSKEFSNTLLKSYLKCEDRCSMHHSVESRTPFADNQALIEYSLSIPAMFKIKNKVSKSIFREAVKSYLPTNIYSRQDKMGYATPNNQWISEIKEDIKDVFSGSNPYLNNDKILNNYDSLFGNTNKPDNGHLFKLISFPIWLSINK